MFKRRVCILLLDSLGIGSSIDSIFYGDRGANTFGNIHKFCYKGFADKLGLRTGPLNIPNLSKLGIYHVVVSSSGEQLIDLSTLNRPIGYYGYAVEKSIGKDTPTGHWELVGVQNKSPFGYFPKKNYCFPQEFIKELIYYANLSGVLGEKHASGTEIIKELGQQHLCTKKPIIYTSSDSVLQIAAHEQEFGLTKLYNTCKIARKLINKYRIIRVIARPFLGKKENFFRTSNRKDYTIPPPCLTLLDILQRSGREVIAIGKISDIFSNQGITKIIKANGNMELFNATLDAIKYAPYGSLIFANFVDFDSIYGHRRDVSGYAYALEQFDNRLPELFKFLKKEDMVIITSDHGCDPTFPGSHHTREHIPILIFGHTFKSRFIGRRDTLADIGQSIAKYLMVNVLSYGVSFIE